MYLVCAVLSAGLHEGRWVEYMLACSVSMCWCETWENNELIMSTLTANKIGSQPCSLFFCDLCYHYPGYDWTCSPAGLHIGVVVTPYFIVLSHYTRACPAKPAFAARSSLQPVDHTPMSNCWVQVQVQVIRKNKRVVSWAFFFCGEGSKNAAIWQKATQKLINMQLRTDASTSVHVHTWLRQATQCQGCGHSLSPVTT